MNREQIRKVLEELKEERAEGLLNEAEYQEQRSRWMQKWRDNQSQSPPPQKNPQPHGADAFATSGNGFAEPVVQPPQFSQEHLFMDRYRLGRLLGEGGMGRVFLAYDTVTEEDYALKLLHPGLANHKHLRKRFSQELKLTRRLAHTGIVQTYALQKDPATGQLFFTMEYLEGQTLEALLDEANQKKQIPPLGLSQVLKIVEQLASALDYAHKNGVVHRDLKPANVMLLENDIIKLMDFISHKQRPSKQCLKRS